ncbi:MAG: hypothetical protein ACYC92_14820 [Candidatus Acidiferrales bacterium]
MTEMIVLKYWRDIALVAALAGAAFLGKQWIDAHDAIVKASATITAQGQLIAQQKHQAQQIADAERRRDAATRQQLSLMQTQVAQLKTAAQIVSWLPRQVSTPAPVKINVPASTKGNPSPDAIATIPQPDLPVLRDYVESCKECALKLSTARQDLASRDAQLKLAGEQLSAMQQERDAALKAMKGGSFWHRLTHNAKLVFFVSLGTAGIVCASGHCR